MRPLAVVLALLGVSIATAAQGESRVRLTYPKSFQSLEAATYDVEGEERVGTAQLVIERTESDTVRMLSRTGFDEGARTILTTELQPIDGDRALRPLWQESRSFDPDGTALGRLRVDHQKKLGICEKGPEFDPADTLRLELPDEDNVVNVPLNLLFIPLARGEKKKVSFQFFLCGGGPRLLDFEARVERRIGENGRKVVEIRYGPDFGTFGSMLLRPMFPRLSIWIDPNAQQPWLAHRVPLYAKGPEVLVVREGVRPSWLEIGPD